MLNSLKTEDLGMSTRLSMVTKLGILLESKRSMIPMLKSSHLRTLSIFQITSSMEKI